MKELKPGIKGTDEVMVTEENTARTMGSGTLDVFATPAMIALMENTAYESVTAELEEGSGTRSSLLWECRKAILQKKPKILVMENVKSLISLYRPVRCVASSPLSSFALLPVTNTRI